MGSDTPPQAQDNQTDVVARFRRELAELDTLYEREKQQGIGHALERHTARVTGLAARFATEAQYVAAEWQRKSALAQQDAADSQRRTAEAEQIALQVQQQTAAHTLTTARATGLLAWFTGAMAAATTILALLTLLGNIQDASANKDTAAMFKLQRRPWLEVSLDTANIDTSVSPSGLTFVPKVHNFGQGAATRFYVAFSIRNTREPIAETSGMFEPRVPTCMLGPGSEVLLQGLDFTLRVSSARPTVCYLHTRVVYFGAETDETYYNEHVFYVNLAYDPSKSMHPAPWWGPEITYLGKVREDLVVFDDGTYLDRPGRERAFKLLADSTSSWFGPEDTTRVEALADSLLRSAGYNERTADFVASGFTLAVTHVYVPRVGPIFPTEGR